jgi:hypothetical protein
MSNSDLKKKLEQLKNTNQTLKVSQGGTNILTLVFILFLGLKLGGVAPVAGWSWWYVTMPIWGGYALIFGILGLVLLGGITIVGIIALIENIKK